MLALLFSALALRRHHKHAYTEEIKLEDKIVDKANDYSQVVLNARNTKFIGCLDSSENHFGGAMYLNKSKIYTVNCLFSLCVSIQAGAVYAIDSHITFVQTNFTQNMAILQGGAGIFLNSEVVLVGGMTKLNEGQFTGGFVFTRCKRRIRRHAFISNTAHSYGPGAVTIEFTPINIQECSFVHNGADEGEAGAIVFDHMDDSSSQVVRCAFITNTVSNKETNIFVRGTNKTRLAIQNCVFDTPIKSTIVTEGSPALQMSGLIFDLQVTDKWHSEAENTENAAWKHTITHDSSNKFAVMMIITTPLFILLCLYLLP